MENYVNRHIFTLGTTKLELKSRGSKDNNMENRRKDEKIRRPLRVVCRNIRVQGN